MIEALIGLLGVIVGALITNAKDILIDRRSRKQNAEYLAIRVVCLLEQFVEGCAGVAGDDGQSYYQPPGSTERDITTPAPEFAAQSLDVDWKSIPARLMYEILSFPVLISEASHRVRNAFEFSHPPDYSEGFEERQYQYAELGLIAVKISNDLRREYRLPMHEHLDWDPVNNLRETQERIKKLRTRIKDKSGNEDGTASA